MLIYYWHLTLTMLNIDEEDKKMMNVNMKELKGKENKR